MFKKIFFPLINVFFSADGFSTKQARCMKCRGRAAQRLFLTLLFLPAHINHWQFLLKTCPSGLLISPAAFLSRFSGHNRTLWTIDAPITTPDLSARRAGFNIHFQIPNLTLLFLLPWQQHYGLPHTLLTVSSSLKRISRVTDRVIYHNCHLAQRLWSAGNKGAATCFFSVWLCLIRLHSPMKHDSHNNLVSLCICGLCCLEYDTMTFETFLSSLPL